MIAADTPPRTTHLTISDASEISGKGVTTVRRWLASGEIRHVKDGNGWVWIERQSLAGFLAVKNGGRAGASVSDTPDELSKKKGIRKPNLTTTDRAELQRLTAENAALQSLVAKTFADKQHLEVENGKLRLRIAAIESAPKADGVKMREPDEFIDAAQKLAGIIRSRIPFGKKR